MAHIATQFEFDNSLFASIGGTQPVRVLTGAEMASFISASATAGVGDIETPTLNGSFLLTIPFIKDGNSESVSVDLSPLAIDVQVASVTYDDVTNSIVVTLSDSTVFNVPITDLIDTISNSLTSSTNSMTSNVNGISSSANIVNSLSLSKNGGGQLIVSVNGVNSSPLTITAANITNTPSGSISSTNVQDAINELDGEKAPLNSPNFAGTPTVPDSTIGSNNGEIANTKYVKDYYDSREGVTDISVSTNTAYISATRNLDNVNGTPEYGSITKVFNPLSSGFDFSGLDGRTIYAYEDVYSSVEFINSNIKLIGNYSVFGDATFSGIVGIEGRPYFSNLELNNLIEENDVSIAKWSSDLIIEDVSSAILIFDSLYSGSDIKFNGNSGGYIQLNLHSVLSPLTIAPLVALEQTFSGGATVNINIDVLDDLLTISGLILEDVNFNINIKQSTTNGRIAFEDISVSDETNITVSGNFSENGGSIKNAGIALVKIGSVTSTSTTASANRVLVKNSSFKTYNVVAVEATTSSNGVNIINSTFVSRGADSLLIGASSYVLNCITNETVANIDYSANANINGYIVQDVNFS